MKRLLSLICIFSMILSSSSAMAEDFTEPNPSTTAITLVRGETPTFDPAQLELRLGLAVDSLQGVTFTQLPPATTGVLLDGETPVAPYEYLTRQTLSGLTFEVADRAASLSFTLLPNAGDAAAATLSYTQSEAHNSPPTITGGSYPAMTGTSVYYSLNVSDPDGDALVVKLGSAPKKGSLRLEDGYFIYTPYPAAWGLDRFSCYTMDSAGNLSPVAVVTIKIQRRLKGPLFADMNGSPHSYCAVMLHDAGVMTGVQAGSRWFFGADQTMTTGQALVLLAAALGEDEDFPSAQSDDAYGGNPAWLQPYVVWATEAGYVDEDTEIDAPMSRWQAVQLIARVVGEDQVTRCDLQLSDAGAIPTQALPAYMTLTTTGIVNHYNGVCLPLDPLTRDYWAELLWRLWEYRQR